MPETLIAPESTSPQPPDPLVERTASLNAVRPRWRRLALRAAFLLPLAWLLYQVYYIYFGPNFHVVLPGKVYRSAQPDDDAVARFVQRHGIRTIVNLRGICTDQAWYLKQCTAVHNLNIAQEDLSFSAKRMPSAHEIKRLIHLLDNVEYPIVFHCRQGADRTGIASVIVRLLFTDDTLPEALRHLTFRYGHLPVGQTLYMDRFFELYAEWLQDRGAQHSPGLFRQWAADGYRGGWCQQAIESVEPLQTRCRIGEPLGFRVRVRNTSTEIWHFRPHEMSGVHLGAEMLSPDNKLVHLVRAGLFERDVTPGQTIELTVAIPPLQQPGTYRLRLDMIDEGHCWFQQAGAEAREEEIVVHE